MKNKENLPIGIGGDKLAEGRETLPAVEVKNVVEWVNPHLQLPFDLREGKPSKLGMFLTQEDYPEDGYELEVHRQHKRSGIIGHVIFKDDEGRLYRDVDVKGIGYAFNDYYNPRLAVRPPVPHERNKESTWGILDEGYARSDIDMSEKFLKAGIRTHRDIALIKLNEIIGSGGRRMGIKEAKEAGNLRSEDEPVVLVRAFGTRMRLEDAYDKRELIEDARLLVAQELGLDPKKFNTTDYLIWLTKTTAQNIARMHKHGWLHGYLSDHNITLDGRIVDLDSVVTEKEALREVDDEKRKSRGEDYGRAEENIMEFLGTHVSDVSLNGLRNIFLKDYNDELGRR
ncbi:MAG: hypothetical protein KGJ89_00550 [Patescibacteria group bacterium]|nr:hypothetical protein [Patescibacteria group bacterium]MDE2015005.1 hypothetical protein [Patescibacteria group bacterium]MDE2226433.1 hypothetical protein [Patescibacteria group bacterium]